MVEQLPIIDFSPFLDPGNEPETKLSTALEIDRACRESGFFYLTHHGVPTEFTDAMLKNATTFFEKASPEAKDEILIKPAGDGIGDDARGFQRIDGGVKGAHEAVDFYRPVENYGPPYETGMGVNQWPTTPTNFRSISEMYTDKMLSLGTAVVRAMALALGVDESALTSRIDQSFWNLRIIAYEGSMAQGKVAGIGAHTDFGILTFLLTDSEKGSLQVLSKGGEWIPADPIEGCFLCNIGDMLSRWTSGIYKSTEHRVIHTSTKRRISVPFFFEPNLDAYISPVLHAAIPDKSTGEGVLYKDMFVKATKYPIVI
ncbi:MAG: hypothetical protein M1834_007022 [Cirrosporium novae-zelandiae]|nr:MAG: hypothetical protein M1834_007022 [Cirrosporium novae-zelandiae]